jgi:hypothetical protein
MRGAHAPRLRNTGGGKIPASNGVRPGAASDSGQGNAGPPESTIWYPGGDDWLQDIRTAYETDQLLKDGHQRKIVKLGARVGDWFCRNTVYIPSMEHHKDKLPKEAILREHRAKPQAGHAWGEQSSLRRCKGTICGQPYGKKWKATYTRVSNVNGI